MSTRSRRGWGSSERRWTRRDLMKVGGAAFGASLAGACGDGGTPAPSVAPSVVSRGQALVTLGAERLVADRFSMLRDRRVGLVTSGAAMVGSSHIVDVLNSVGRVDLKRLFSPEHGLRTNVEAGEAVADGLDPVSGLEVRSLYGDQRRPRLGDLLDLDVMVFDMQDVGVRFYTYISTLGYAMQAAAEAGIEFVVLDRPNPLGGERVTGWVLEPEWSTFVGLYPVPVVHGLTMGELALMIRGEGWLPGLESLELTVVEMDGWTRAMSWPETGLEWHAPSPNLPEVENTFLYPGMALLEGTIFNEGRGTTRPFLMAGGEGIDSEKAAEALNAIPLRGLRLEPVNYRPRAIEGVSTSPKFLDQRIPGVQLSIEELRAVRPFESGLMVVRELVGQLDDPEAGLTPYLDALAGTDRLRKLLLLRATPSELRESWRDEVRQFRRLRDRYLIYA